MPAFSDNRMSYLGNATNQLRRRMLGHVRYDFTHDDVLQGFVPESLREFASTGRQLFDVSYSSTAFTFKVHLQGSDLDVRASLNQTKTPDTRPLLPKTSVYPLPGSPVANKIEAWVNPYFDVVKQFTIVHRTLEELNVLCTSEQQVRFFMPGLLVLLEYPGMPEPMRLMADKLRTSKTPRVIPTLPLWLREGCQLSSTVLAAASLMPQPEDVRREVDLAISGSFRFEFHGKQMTSYA